MSRTVRNALQVGIVIGVALLLWLGFPWVIRFIEAAAFSVRRFWWIILLFALAGWSAWVLKKRNPL